MSKLQDFPLHGVGWDSNTRTEPKVLRRTICLPFSSIVTSILVVFALPPRLTTVPVPCTESVPAAAAARIQGEGQGYRTMGAP